MQSYKCSFRSTYCRLLIRDKLLPITSTTAATKQPDLAKVTQLIQVKMDILRINFYFFCL